MEPVTRPELTALTRSIDAVAKSCDTCRSERLHVEERLFDKVDLLRADMNAGMHAISESVRGISESVSALRGGLASAAKLLALGIAVIGLLVSALKFVVP